MKTVSRLCILTAAAGAMFAMGIAQADESQAIKLNCGGFGGDESSRMLSEQSRHALTLIFATAEGSYVGGARARVEGPQGQSVEKRCGPIGQLDVSRAGNYRIMVEHGGETVRHSAHLQPGAGQRVVLRLPDQ